MSLSTDALGRGPAPAPAPGGASELHVPPPPPARREWRRAWRALRDLIRDSSRTEKVFEIFDAVGGGGDERQFQAFLARPEGRALAHERPSLVEAMADREALEALPEGSLGRAYHAFATANGFAADGLIEAEMAAEREDGISLDPLRRWFYDRVTVSHDLWHVLTGYGTDESGEAALLAFTVAQFPTGGLRLLVGAAAVVGFCSGAFGFPRYLREAWRRGRSAGDLVAAPMEKLIRLPLEETRRRLGIPPLAEAHPRGRYVGSRKEGNLVRDAA